MLQYLLSLIFSPVPDEGRRYPEATTLKWPPKVVGFPNLQLDQTLKTKR